MKAATHLLATAAILISACNGNAPDAATNNVEASAAEGEQAMLCAFEPSDTKDWSGRANADQSVTVEGKAHSGDPKYKAALFHHEVDESVARVYLTKAESNEEAPADGWWVVSYTVPDDGSIKTVEIWCDRDTKFQDIPVRRGTQTAGGENKRVDFRGCPKIVNVEKPGGCLAINSGGVTYDIDSAQPRPDPGKLIIEGTGIYDPGKVGICQTGKILTDVKWNYTKAKCPLGDGNQ